jgi:ferredoxin-NADP reductase
VAIDVRARVADVGEPGDAATATDTLVQELVVVRIALEALGVISVTFAAPDGSELPAWEPGAHLEVTLPSGMIRQYSLCGDDLDRRTYTVAVLREPEGRGGSLELHDIGLVGRTLAVRGPRNRFPLVEAEHYLLLAGGIGITPVLAMARALQRRGSDWTLHYAGRRLSSMAFVEELRASPDGRVLLHPADGGARMDVRQAIAEMPEGTAVYCCGPLSMIDAVAEACEELGVSAGLHLERFSGAAVDTDLERTPFEVELGSTGETVQVGADQTIIEALEGIGVEVAFSCEEGYCGTCETVVLEGVPEHHDTVLTEAEHKACDRMMICVGRARSARLVLDL